MVGYHLISSSPNFHSNNLPLSDSAASMNAKNVGFKKFVNSLESGE